MTKAQDLDIDGLGKLLGGKAELQGTEIFMEWGGNTARVKMMGAMLVWIHQSGETATEDLTTKMPPWSRTHSTLRADNGSVPGAVRAWT